MKCIALQENFSPSDELLHYQVTVSHCGRIIEQLNEIAATPNAVHLIELRENH